MSITEHGAATTRDARRLQLTSPYGVQCWGRPSPPECQRFSPVVLFQGLRTNENGPVSRAASKAERAVPAKRALAALLLIPQPCANDTRRMGPCIVHRTGCAAVEASHFGLTFRGNRVGSS